MQVPSLYFPSSFKEESVLGAMVSPSRYCNGFCIKHLFPLRSVPHAFCHFLGPPVCQPFHEKGALPRLHLLLVGPSTPDPHPSASPSHSNRTPCSHVTQPEIFPAPGNEWKDRPHSSCHHVPSMWSPLRTCRGKESLGELKPKPVTGAPEPPLQF